MINFLDTNLIIILSDCNPVQFLAITIREVSVMLVYEIFNSFKPVQFSEIEMILASDN